ncbi:MAG TPA: hypothetical protein VFP72_11825 [Kineosporiaceae bacterium]|nr:hypothetical protein [Kineosporiaceae bacterium]
MTFAPGTTASRGGLGAAVRTARAGAVCLLAVPAMLLAHLVTARAIPSAGVIALVCAVVLVVTAACGSRSRWRLALTVGLAQAAGHGLLAVLHPATGPDSSGGCLPMVGRGAALGLRLAFLQQDAACRPGTLATGPTAAVAVGALLTALLILTGHGLVAVLAAVLVCAGHLAVEAVRACLGSVTFRTANPPGIPVDAPRRMLPGLRTVHPLQARWQPGPARRRGPPAVLPAG